MKLLLSFAVSILIAWPLSALSHASELPELVAGSAAARPQQSTSGFGPDSEILLPVVINTPGLNGTFFKTDGFFANFRNINQEALVRFLPAGVSGAGQPAMR